MIDRLFDLLRKVPLEPGDYFPLNTYTTRSGITHFLRVGKGGPPTHTTTLFYVDIDASTVATMVYFREASSWNTVAASA